MKAAHSPESFGIALAPNEMDVMVEVWRMFVRDYETDERHDEILAGLEEAYAQSGRELAGGRLIDAKYLFGDPDLLTIEDDEEDGGSAVSLAS